MIHSISFEHSIACQEKRIEIKFIINNLIIPGLKPGQNLI